MTTLATRDRTNGPPAVAPLPGPAGLTFEQIWEAANYVAESKLFPVTTPQQAFTLMMICNSEGLHPMQALKRYHIIQGRPTMRSDAMQAAFQADGGRIKILVRSRTEARAVFSHPTLQPEGIELAVTFDQFRQAGLTGKDVWKNYPDDMLWARLVTKGVRTVHPGIIAGIYSTDEAQDMEAMGTASVQIAASQVQAAEAVDANEIQVTGQPVPGHDPRRFHQVVTAASEALDVKPRDVYAYLVNRMVQLGHGAAPKSQTASDIVKALNPCYDANRDWMRAEINTFAEEHREEERDRNAAFAAQAAAEGPQEDDGDPDGDLPGHEREPGEEG